MKKILLLFLTISIHSTLFGQLNNGLVGQYYFNNGNANDDLGFIHGAENNTSLTTDRFGCPNRAYHFNPADTSFISLGDNFDSAFVGTVAEFSISIWFRRTDLNHKHEFLVAKYGSLNCSEDEREIVFEINTNDKLYFLYYTGLGMISFRGIAGTTSILDTLWHHAVVSYNASANGNNGQDRIALYLDGVQETTTLASSTGSLSAIQDGVAHFAIGASLSSTGTYCGPDPNTSYAFAGDLDDIRIYDRTLSFSEIGLLFNETDSCSMLGMASVSSTKELFKLYPNPTNANLTIELLNNITEQSFVEIFNLQGQLVQRIENISGQNSQTIDVIALPSGLYHVALKDKKGIILQGLRFVKH